MPDSEIAFLSRVTCEEHYNQPEAAPAPKCTHCGDYGYLGVPDELCTACIDTFTNGD